MTDIVAKLVGGVDRFDGIPRDAIHVPVIPVEVGATVRPGQKVTLKANKLFPATTTFIGVVDPFIHEMDLTPGKVVLLFLRPGSITSLSHHWTHPQIPSFTPAPDALTEEAHAVIRKMADDMGLSVKALLNAAEDYLKHGEYYTFSGHDVPDTTIGMDEFWKAYAKVKDCRVPPSADYFFSCFC